MTAPTISLCMIVKDEEKILERHLKHIKDYVDEIIIVDTGSKDKTKEIAKKFTKKVYDFKWCDDFSKAWNFSISKATKDWLLILAADEFVEKPEKLKDAIAKSKADIITLKQLAVIVDYDKLDKEKYEIFNALNNSPVHYKTKLFKRSLGLSYKYPIHEVPVVANKNNRSVTIGLRIFHLTDASTDAQDYEYYASLCEKAVESGNFDCNIICNLIDYYIDKRSFNKIQDLLENASFEVDEDSVQYIQHLVKLLLSLNRTKEAKKLADIIKSN